MRPECWTSQGSVSCSPWNSVCHDWTATDATHNFMPGCENILAVTASWLICVCGFCLWSIRSCNCHVWWLLWMKELLNLLQKCWVWREGPITWSGIWCDFTLLDIFGSNVTEDIYHISWPIRRTFFPEKCDLNLTCILFAGGNYYFQTYKYLYICYAISLS